LLRQRGHAGEHFDSAGLRLRFPAWTAERYAQGYFNPRGFLRESLPALAEAPIIGRRLCLYCDTWDGNFWIARDPEWEGLVVTAGGSGHAFKFAPLIGGIIAEVVEGRPNRFAHRFAWRGKGRLAAEGARFSG